MKKYKHLMAFIAVVLVFAMTFSSISIPANAATTAKAKSITIKKLPSNTLTLKKGKTFTIKTNVSKTKLKYTTSNKKVITVTKNGKIKAIKKGKANITVSLKSDPKVKKVIHVTVGKPVTKVKLNKTSLLLVKGKNSTLKAKITPAKPSNKKLIWKSSKPTVVKVSSSGKITGIKAGTATITATAADGSGKKASCKVTVVNPTKIASVSMPDPQTAKVVLSSAQKLSASNFSAKAGTVLNGTFPVNVQIESVTTTDNKTYILKFSKKPLLDFNMNVRITVTGLYGTGTATTETNSSFGAYKVTLSETYNCKQNVPIGKKMEFKFGYGYYNYTVKDLPAGITYTKDTTNYNTIYFTGTPTKTGTTVSTVIATDEKGCVTTMKITWNIYSDSVIIASYNEKKNYYTIPNSSTTTETQVSCNIYYTCGGSGTYTYALVDNQYELFIDKNNGLVYGNLTKEGTYNIRVKVSDAKNPQISTTIICPIHIVRKISVSGYVKSKDGSIMTYYDGLTFITFYNVDTGYAYMVSGDAYSNNDKDGKYYVSILPGTYNIELCTGDDRTYLYSQTFTHSVTDKTLVSDTRKITIRPDKNGYDMNRLGKWTDTENSDSLGLRDHVFLSPGTYDLISSSDEYDEIAVIHATVTSKTTTLTATIKSKTAAVTEGKAVETITGQRYKFVPTKTGTYYFYSVSEFPYDPRGYLYDENMTQLASNDNTLHKLTENRFDFCISYNCEAGKTYYLTSNKGQYTLYISSVNPGTGK